MRQINGCPLDGVGEQAHTRIAIHPATCSELLPVKRTVKNHKIFATSNTIVTGCFYGYGLPREARAATAATTKAALSSYKARLVGWQTP